MKRFTGIALLALMTVGLWLPSESVAQYRRARTMQRSTTIYQTQTYGRRRYRNRNRSYNGYRNYGQYRRTQVGNRSWRWRMRHSTTRGYRTNGYRYNRYSN